MLQQVKIMFTPEAALIINLAVKDSTAPPLDSQNQRVFNDVLEHGVHGDFYRVELESGMTYQYPSHKIERIRSHWLNKPTLTALSDDHIAVINNAIDLECADELAKIDAELAKLDDELAEIDAELASELAQINAELDGELAQIDAELGGELAALDEQLASELIDLGALVAADLVNIDLQLFSIE